MRTLRFIVNDQIIKQDETCDFSDIVSGTKGYLKAEFIFSPKWIGCAKVAAFYSPMGTEYQPQILNGNTCIIPEEATKRNTFKIQILGKKRDFTITTNKLEVRQDGGKL